MQSISLTSIAIGAAPFVVVLFLKLLLDLKLAQLSVKYLFWLPVRNYFREKPVKLKGTWEHTWGSGGSDSYTKDTQRHGHSKIRQLGSYIYAEFHSRNELYAFFGQIRHGYIVGDWYDTKDHLGYFGTFQLEVVNSSHLRGLWLGHSKQSRQIRSDATEWRRIDG